MTKPKKTNACRALDQLSVPYEVLAYEVDLDDLSAENVAAKLGRAPGQLFKTLCVAAQDRAVLLAVVPGDRELDLKALARAADKRSLESIPMKALLATTGYVRGGVTALACKKPYPVFVDERALAFTQICVSAGQRGLQILLSPHDYLRATGGTVAMLSRPKT